MKKLFCMLLALLLWTPVMAEESQRYVLPVKIIDQGAASIPMAEAVLKAHELIHEIQVVNSVRSELVGAELVELVDGKIAWVVTTFDASSLAYAWMAMVDAANGDVIYIEASNDGYLTHVLTAWTDVKGPQALWSLEDKQLYDALYAIQPCYGLPVEGDLSAEAALEKVLTALGLTSTDDYEVGYGYIMGGEGVSGVWEVCLVQNGQIVYQVNLDAVTGEIYYIYPDEAGNG